MTEKILKFNQKKSRAHIGFQGFTVTELVVSVSIFAVTITLMMVLFDNTLKIQRKTEALRQASQGMRNFIEFFVKEVRNGKIDYGVSGGVSLLSTQAPCPNPSSLGSNTFGQSAFGAVEGSGPTVFQAETRLPLVNLFNEQECLFWAKDVGLGGLAPVVSSDVTNGLAKHLALAKNGVSGYEKLNPNNMTIDYLRFYIRPLCDPYSSSCAGGLPMVQPFVTIVMRFVVTLSTGEKVIVPYQTTITTDDYAIPRN